MMVPARQWLILRACQAHAANLARLARPLQCARLMRRLTEPPRRLMQPRAAPLQCVLTQSHRRLMRPLQPTQMRWNPEG